MNADMDIAKLFQKNVLLKWSISKGFFRYIYNALNLLLFFYNGKKLYTKIDQSCV